MKYLLAPLLLICLFSQFGFGAEPVDLNLSAGWREDPEVKQCGLCHYSPGNEFAQRSTDFCQFTELKTWLDNDRHASARARIEPIVTPDGKQMLASQQLSQRILSKLGWDPATDVGYEKYRSSCLTCHAGVGRELPTTSHAKDESKRPGISCIACHQLDTNDRWIDLHSRMSASTTWRNLSPEAKAAEGLRPVVSAPAQAQLCFSCHIGDLKLNRFVTHQMMSAGHPPLTAVEPSTWALSMPQHWRSPDQIVQSLRGNQAEREAYFRSAYQLSPSQSVTDWASETQTIVQSAIVAQRHVVQQFEYASSTGNHWGDYALYDCSGCHHGLVDRSWRQRNALGLIPGRPMPPRWTSSLFSVASQVVGPSEALTKSQQSFQTAVTVIPFGDARRTTQTAGELTKALDELLAKTCQLNFNEAVARDVLTKLVQLPPELVIDYQSARQIVWAMQRIDHELTRLERPLDGRTQKQIQQLSKHRGSGSTQLLLELPSMPGHELYPGFVRSHLRYEAAFDAEEFYEQLKAFQP